MFPGQFLWSSRFEVGFSRFKVSFHGFRLVFHGSRWVFIVIHGSRPVLWFQVGFYGFSRSQVGFSWFQVFFFVIHGSNLVFHSFMSVFIFLSRFQVCCNSSRSLFHDARSVFMVQGQFVWLFKIPG